MKTKEELKLQIEQFSDLHQNWDTYNADEITIPSIMTAHKVIDGLPQEVINFTNVFPMRDGGVQIDVGNFKEIEIKDYSIREIKYDINLNVVITYSYSYEYNNFEKE